MILSPNQSVQLDDGRVAVVTKVLGDGAQGEVYLAMVGGKEYALKMYKKAMSKEFSDNLRTNIAAGSPSQSFIWPLAITKNDGVFGYLMELIPEQYRSFISMVNGQTHFNSLRSQLNWCINICTAFKELHSRGYSYQDLNDGSFFLEPETGNALICDNDNVTADTFNLGILGKMKYMAPEVITGKNVPDKYSDYFSLAVILFLSLTLSHPFIGERLRNFPCFDEIAEDEMFGEHPVYIFDKSETYNRPIHGYNPYFAKRWRTIPAYIKDGFSKVFEDGLKDRENGRLTELEWIKLLFKWRDELVTCHKDNFQFAASLGNCPNCNEKAPVVTSLTVSGYEIKLDLHTKLYEPHIDKFSANYGNVVGEVVSNKNDPSLWGIRNLSKSTWIITDSAGHQLSVQPFQVAPIVSNLTIAFDETTVGSIN